MIDSKKFKRLLSRRYAKICVVGGVICCVVGFCLTLASLFGTYSSADCVQQAAGCSLSHELYLAKLGNILIYIGMALALAGIVPLVIMALGRKRQHSHGHDTIRH